jgi:acetoin utilization protein AcuB
MGASVKEWMTGDPVSIEPGASALAALDLMIERGIRHLPVVDGAKRVVGIVSIDDLRAALPIEVSLRRAPSAAERRAIRDYAIGELMTHAPEVAHGDGALEEAAQRIADHRIGALPVIDADGRLEGILSETDVLNAVATSLWTDRVRERRGARREQEALVDELRAERERLRRTFLATGREEDALLAESQASGIDDEERATDLTGARTADSVHAFASRRLAALDRALALAEAGRLTRCERCGGEIALARLRAMPGATTCIACAREQES